MPEPHWLNETQQQAWRAFLTGSAWLQEKLNEDLEVTAGMSLHEYEVLVRLSEAADGSVRMSLLAEQLVHSRSRLTHTVARMEKRGWVNREPCSDDGRGVQAVMTDQGRQVLVDAAPGHVQSVRDNLIDLLTEEQVEVMGQIFTTVATRLYPEAAEVMAISCEEATL